LSAAFRKAGKPAFPDEQSRAWLKQGGPQNVQLLGREFDVAQSIPASTAAQDRPDLIVQARQALPALWAAQGAGPMSAPQTIPRERLRHLASRLHPLGPRPLFELLVEIDRGADLHSRLEAYARIDRRVLRTLGGDKLPPSTRLVE
jgi:hypothetical protein